MRTVERAPTPYYPKRQPPRRRSSRSILGRLLGLAILLGSLGAGALGGLLWYYGRDLPSVTALRDYRPPQTTRVLDRNGQLVGEIYVERRTVVPNDQIPRVVVLSVLAAEDADFYVHEGLDYRGIARAILRDILERRAVQGASTITQQVVKLMLLSSERTLSRKVKELILARRLEQQLSKDEILHLYLNHINFGNGRYGIEEGARYYFGKHARQLNLAEASMLAGIPQSPSRQNPFRNAEAARRRQLYVLGQLEAKRAEYWPDLTPEQIREARDTALAYADPNAESGAAPEIMRIARTTLRERVGQAAFERGGFTVHTTIDVRLERAAREALRHGLEQLDERNGYRGPLRRRTTRGPREELAQIAALRTGQSYPAEVTGADDQAGRIFLDVGGHRAFVSMASIRRYNPTNLPASAFAERLARTKVSIEALGDETSPARARLELGPEGAIVVVDPRSRDVLALVGAYEESAGFDRAIQALRQPGSTFKAFVYAEALRTRAVTPASLMSQEPIDLGTVVLRAPDSEDSLSPVRLRMALARSINPVAVSLLQRVGEQQVIAFARTLGITSELEANPSLALGASEVRLIELVNAYATFAAGGRFGETRIVSRIESPDGSDVPLPAPPAPRQVMSPAEAFLITSLLRSVVDEGTAVAARALGRQLAGKTGTSNDARDAWFVGFSPVTVAGVWVGFDDRRPLGRRESGAKSALPIWMAVMRAAEQGRRPVPFTVPTGIETARIDPSSGKHVGVDFPGALEEYFLAGTVPTEEPVEPTMPIDAAVPPSAPAPMAPVAPQPSPPSP